jgi:hypothetical protein
LFICFSLSLSLTPSFPAASGPDAPGGPRPGTYSAYGRIWPKNQGDYRCLPKSRSTSTASKRMRWATSAQALQSESKYRLVYILSTVWVQRSHPQSGSPLTPTLICYAYRGGKKLLPGKTPVGKILSQISGQYFPGLLKDWDRIFTAEFFPDRNFPDRIFPSCFKDRWLKRTQRLL